MRSVETIHTMDGDIFGVIIKPEAENDLIKLSIRTLTEKPSAIHLNLTPDEAIELARIMLNKGLEAQQWRSEMGDQM